MDYLIDRYLEYLSHIRDPKTVRQKKYWLAHLERFGTLNLSARNLAEFFRYLKEKGLKDNTIEQILRDARKFIRWVQKHYPETEAYFDDETFEEIKLAKRKNLKPKDEEETFTDEQLKLILETAKDYGIFFYFTLLLAYSGLRLSEALALTVKDFNQLSENVWEIKVREAKFGKGRTAYLILPEEYISSWRYFITKAKYRKGLWRYKYPTGGKVYTLTSDKVVKFYLWLSEELGFKVNAHKFRKTFTVWLLKRGLDIASVQKLLGHSSAKTTLEYYAKINEEDLREQVLKISG